MGSSAVRRIERIGAITFRGKVGKNIAAYAKETQQLGRDLGRQLDHDAGAAERAMRKLKKHPRLRHVNVYVRARWVSRHLRQARDLCTGICTEAVKFNLESRRQFIDIDKPRKHTGEVDL
ncbi:hypothetical protein [Actinomadura rudentiformis]|uniref:Uncharacterized protein n=1 Tax=Actinomadura rudentiformis TaxID=359158 RepID=A0A6H9YK89_9ACTN|nr:hypothetical protein [Actinomadura rudentiformis]KAB2341513.1 hypothetical protein F8566_40935 [Actinomadura rudentiformis]